MRPVLAAAVLAGPTALAFFDGGYFAGPRDIALVVAGVLLALAGATQRLPRSRPALLAYLGLAGLTAWTAASIAWAPLTDPAWATFERDLLYLAALLTAAMVLRGRTPEVALAGGALVVVGYGLVLTARIAGDHVRAPALRSAAAAAAVPLLAGLYLTYSRGAIAACAAGLVVLVALTPTWTQLRALAIVVEAGALGIFGAAATDDERGVAWLAAVMVLAAGVQLWSTSVEAQGTTRLGRLPLPPRHGWIAAGVVLAMLVVPAAIAAGEDGPNSAGERFGASAGRLATADSPRYAYWDVALRGFGEDPVVGAGAGSFAVTWLRERDERKPARDAHSLELETLAELGLLGAAFLVLFGAGLALAARDVVRGDPALAAGPVAALAAYAFHASIDWDWEVPALTLVAVLLAGLLIAESATAASTTNPGSAANRNRVEP
ncbi:MAG: O-antigen ligase family protein [Solirubrobacterales bacterium]|nr:O-antigen ligase family protein [Solirubrobacterales bacterium]